MRGGSKCSRVFAWGLFVGQRRIEPLRLFGTEKRIEVMDQEQTIGEPRDAADVFAGLG